MPLSPAEDYRQTDAELVEDMTDLLRRLDAKAKQYMDRAQRDLNFCGFRYAGKFIESLEPSWRILALIPKQPS